MYNGKTKKKYKIIFSAEQVGGIDALLPVIKIIQNNKKFKFVVFFDNKNIYKYAKKKNIRNLRFINLPFGGIEKIIKKQNPDLVFTDTNNTEFENSIDKKIIKITKTIGKPTISIVDAWINYKDRFGEKLEYVPD